MKLLKPNDVARQLAVSRACVYEAARTGRIPSIRIGGKDGPLRFVPEDLEAWLATARAEWVSVTADPVPRRTIQPGARAAGTSARTRPRAGSKAVDQQSLL
ncbi:MAG: helix-turn-helix domain-containing protein [Solirubrobacterales bacterium]|nr:helix-turn-helix domain-containing protein [Solirubrobacterales bacterium]